MPGPNDQAIFDLPGSSDVFFDVNPTNLQLRILQGAVGFNLESGGVARTYTLTTVTSIIVGDTMGDNPSLSVYYGTLRGNGDLVVGANGPGTLNIGDVIAGGNVSDANGYVGDNPGVTGGVTVQGAGSTWMNSSDLYIGNRGTGTLDVLSGGSVSSRWGHLGCESGSNGTATVDGTGSAWTVGTDLLVGNHGTGTLAVKNAGRVTITNDLYIGNRGTGTLDVLNGGTVSNRSGYIGYDITGNGTATVDGAGSTWTNSGTFWVGYYGSGTLSVKNGGTVSSSHSQLGREPGSNGTATVDGDGSEWTITGDLNVGNYGIGALDVKNRGNVSNRTCYLGYWADSSGTVTVDGAGSTWTNSASLLIGTYGTGELNVQNGGRVESVEGRLGNRGAGKGTAMVTGAGSTWALSGDLHIGHYGTDAALSVVDGSTVSNRSGYIGHYDTANGTATVAGAGSTWTNSARLLIGVNGTGQLDVQTGGRVESAEGYLGYGFSSSWWSGVTSCGVGNASVWTGSTWKNSGVLAVGLLGDGHLVVRNGGEVSSATGVIGSDSHLFLTVTGYDYRVGMGIAEVFGVWANSGDLIVGDAGNGRLEVLAGGRVSNANGYVGKQSIWETIFGAERMGGFGNAVVSGTGSEWTNDNALYVGYQGEGNLTIDGGGKVSSVKGEIGYGAPCRTFTLLQVRCPGHGEVTVQGAGSEWVNTETLVVGRLGDGTLNVLSGGRVSNGGAVIGLEQQYWGEAPIGKSYPGHGTVTVSGRDADGNPSTWTSAGDLSVGIRGHGTLNVEDGGKVLSFNGYLGRDCFYDDFLRDPYPGVGTATVDGADSLWSNAGSLYVGSGKGGSGALTVSNGGEVFVGHTLQVWDAGSVNLNTGGLIVAGRVERVAGSTFNTQAGSTLRANGLAGFGSTPTFGGVVEIGHSGGLGNVNVGAGQDWTFGERLVVGYDAEASLEITGGTISDGGAGADLVIRQVPSAGGELSGWGNVNLGGTLTNNGRVIADGYGTDRLLALTSFASVDNTIENTGTNGWFAQNHGALTLPSLSIATGSSWYNWGEATADTSVDLVNSFVAQFTGVTAGGTLAGSLLAPDRSDVPASLYHAVGVWQVDPSIGLGFASASLTFRYDDSLAATLGVSEANLRVLRYDGGTWVDVTNGPPDVGNHHITTTDLSGFSFFAVAVLPPPALTDTFSSTASGSWSSATDWDNQVPVGGEDAYVGSAWRGSPTAAMALASAGEACHNLYLADGVGTSGVVTMTAGDMTAGGNVLVGVSGTGQFVQSGGIATLGGALHLGVLGGSTGTYTLDDGTLNAPTIGVGVGGTGQFNWNGGTLNTSLVKVGAGGTLVVGHDWDYAGALNVNGGQVHVAGSLTTSGPLNLGPGGFLAADVVSLEPGATFIAGAGSTLRANGLLGFVGAHSFGGSLEIGHSGGSGSGNWTIGAGQSFAVAGRFLLGNNAPGALAVESGGTLTVGDYFQLGLNNGRGTVIQSGGTVVVTNGVNIFGSGSSYTMDGAGAALSADYVALDPTCWFDQSAGTCNVNSVFVSDGGYTLSGAAQLNASFSTDVYGFSSAAIFTQTGGNHTTGWLSLTSEEMGDATYHLSGTDSRLDVTNDVFLSSFMPMGTVSFVHADGTHTVGGQVEIGLFCSYSLEGGTLIADSVARLGTFTQTGGTLRVNRLTYFGNHPTFGGNLEIGHSGGSGQGTHAVGAGQSLDVTGHLLIGYDAPGTLSVQNGGSVLSEAGFVGCFSGSNGTATVDGAGSTWTLTADLSVGNLGIGTLGVTNGGRVSSQAGFLGGEVLSNGTAGVEGADSAWTMAYDLYLGVHGTGALDVRSGGNVSNRVGLVGSSSDGTGTATVDGAGSTWSSSGSLYVGGSDAAAGGTGNVTVSNGGEVRVGDTLKLWPGGTLAVDGGKVAIGGAAPVGGEVCIGAGGTLCVLGTATVSNAVTLQGGGLLDQQGGSVTVPTFNCASGGTFNHDDGTFTVHGGTYAPGTASLTVNGNTPTALPHLVLDGATPAGSFDDVYVGNSAQGALTITGGSQVSSGGGYVGYAAGSTGMATVDGGGSAWSTTGNLSVGYSGAGTLAVTGGGQVSSTLGLVGLSPGSTGEVTVDGGGSQWTTSSNLLVGCSGTGTLAVTGGGTVSTTGEGSVGANAGSTGEVAVDGSSSQWTITTNLYVGLSGAGTLAVTGGGQVAASGWGSVGYHASSTGEVTVYGSDSTWTTTYLVVGYSGAGTLAVTGGGQVATSGWGSLGYSSGSTGEATVDGSGSTWTSIGSLYVGGGDSAAGGPGTLTVQNEGLVSVGGTLKLWPAGALVVDGGTVTAGSLAGPAGAVVALRDPATGTALTVGSAASDSYAGTLCDDTGPGSLTKVGAGTQTLVGAGITYTGATTVLGGKLKLSDTTAFASGILNSAATEFAVSTGIWTFDEGLGGGGTFVKSGAGTLVVAGPQDYGPGALFDVLGGVLALETDATGTGLMADAHLALSAAADAEVRFAAAQHLDTLTVADGGQVVFAGADRAAMRHLANTGAIDLAAAALVVDYDGASPLADVAAWVRSGLNAGAGYWDGPGIASSTAAADPKGLTAVGVLDNTDPKVGGKTTFAGEAVDATAVLVKYTWWGDANLDGVVDANDYDVIDVNYLFPPAPENMGWWTGDFTYDGTIDANDYDRIDRAYLFQTGPLASGLPTQATTPEPATLALVALGGLSLLGRRRRVR